MAPLDVIDTKFNQYGPGMLRLWPSLDTQEPCEVFGFSSDSELQFHMLYILRLLGVFGYENYDSNDDNKFKSKSEELWYFYWIELF